MTQSLNIHDVEEATVSARHYPAGERSSAYTTLKIKVKAKSLNDVGWTEITLFMADGCDPSLHIEERLG